MIDGERLHEVRRVGNNWLVHAVEANLHGAGFDAGAVEHVLEAHAGPTCVSHRSVRPLCARDARLEIATRIARALVDGGKLNPWQRL